MKRKRGSEGRREGGGDKTNSWNLPVLASSLLPLTSQFPSIKALIWHFVKTCIFLDSPCPCSPTNPLFPFLFSPFHFFISSHSFTSLILDIFYGYKTLLFLSFLILFNFPLLLFPFPSSFSSFQDIFVSTPSFLFKCRFILESLVSLETIFPLSAP